jgi:hypothetical protein
MSSDHQLTSDSSSPVDSPERYYSTSNDSQDSGVSSLRDLLLRESSTKSSASSSLSRRSINGLDSREIKELEKQSEKLQTKVAKLSRADSTRKSLSPFQTPSTSSKSKSSPPAVRTASNSPASPALSNPLQKIDVLCWYKTWKNKKREVKVQTIYQNLMPRLQDTSDKLRLWLEEVMAEKKLAVTNAMKLYQEMILAVDICQSHIDMYDEIFNDCFQIGLDLKREILDLKTALEFGKEIIQNGLCLKRTNSGDEKKACDVSSSHNHPHLGVHHLQHHRTHRSSSSHRVRDQIQSNTTATACVVKAAEVLPPPLPPVEPAIWHGYHGQEGKHIHVAKSAGIASLVAADAPMAVSSVAASSNSSQLQEERISLSSSQRSSSLMIESPRDRLAASSSSQQSNPRSSSPEASNQQRPRSSFSLSNVFSSSTSHDSSAAESASAMESSPRTSFKLSSLMSTRRRSLGNSTEASHCAMLPHSSSLNMSTRARSMTASSSCSNSASPSTMKRVGSLAINSSTSSLNSLLMEFNTSACTIELDHLFQESAQLLAQSSNDPTIEEIVNRMKQFKAIKESIAQFILDVKLAREQAMKNKKTCKQIRDDLEAIIHSKQLTLPTPPAASSSSAEAITPSTSPESVSMLMSMSRSSQQQSQTSTISDGVAMLKQSPVPDGSHSPRSPCTSDGRLSPSHHQHETGSSVYEHPTSSIRYYGKKSSQEPIHPLLQLQLRRLSVDSHSNSSSNGSGHDTDASSRRPSYECKSDPVLSASSSTADQASSSIASQCIDELKVS